jgi:hypothetical protein
MVNQKKGTQLHYELFLIFERFKGFSVKDIIEKLNRDEQQFSRSTLYNWHRRYNRADRKARELTKNW